MATSLENIYSIGPTLRSYKFDLSFTRLPDGSPLGTPAREVHLRCLSADVPSKTGQNITVQLHGHTLYEPGIYTPSGNLTLTLVETIDLQISKLIDFLKQCVWKNNTGVQGDMQSGGQGKDMSFEFILRHLDNQDNTLMGYKLKRCFWNSGAMPQLSGATPEVYKPQIVITYTDFEMVD